MNSRPYYPSSTELKPKRPRAFFRLLWAMFRRWAYLLFVGMWRGECAYTVWQRGRIKILGSGKPIHGIPGVFKNYKIWYD